MRKDEAFPSKWLGKSDLIDGPILVTIESVGFEDVQVDSGTESKTVMYFREANIKPLIVNVTNWDRIETAYGAESDEWIGKTIEVYHDPNVMFGRDKKGGTRVRIPNGKPAAAPPPADEAAPPKEVSWDDVLSKAVEAGLTEQQLKEELKSRGLKGYSPTRDGPTALRAIEVLANTIPF